MATVNIASSSNLTSIRLKEQGSTPSTPPTGFANLFVDGTPSLKLVNDGGTVSTMSVVGHTHGASDIASGTLTHERGGLEADVSAYSGLIKISAGATSQAVGGTDYANATHTHSASDVTSGTFDNARINWASPSAIGSTTPSTGAFSTLTVNGSAGTFRNHEFRTANIPRVYLTLNNTAESGANAGSNFDINTFADDGSYLYTALQVTRATGTLTAVPTYSNALTGTTRSMVIKDNGSIGYLSSTRATKNSIVSLLGDEVADTTISQLRALNPVSFYYNDDMSGQRSYGLIAEEVESTNPHWGVYDKVLDSEGNDTGELSLVSVNYHAMHAMAIAGLQHALNKIDMLETTIATLLARIEALEGA